MTSSASGWDWPIWQACFITTTATLPDQTRRGRVVLPGGLGCGLLRIVAWHAAAGLAGHADDLGRNAFDRARATHGWRRSNEPPTAWSHWLRFLMPAVSLIDGFVAAEGEGPRHGRRAPLGTIIAGTDAVAVDAVAAAVMGFEPLEIAYLRLAQAMGLGTADPDAITIVGDPITPSRRLPPPLRPTGLLRLAGTTRAERMTPRPHFDPIRARRSTRTEA